MVCNAESVETALIKLIAFDRQSDFAAKVGPPVYGQSVKPFNESCHRPVAFPKETRILRMGKPLKVRSLCQRQWRLANVPPPQEESDGSCERYRCQRTREFAGKSR